MLVIREMEAVTSLPKQMYGSKWIHGIGQNGDTIHWIMEDESRYDRFHLPDAEKDSSEAPPEVADILVFSRRSLAKQSYISCGSNTDTLSE